MFTQRPNNKLESLGRRRPGSSTASSVSSGLDGGTDFRSNPLLETPCRAVVCCLRIFSQTRNRLGRNIRYFRVFYGTKSLRAAQSICGRRDSGLCGISVKNGCHVFPWGNALGGDCKRRELDGGRRTGQFLQDLFFCLVRIGATTTNILLRHWIS